MKRNCPGVDDAGDQSSEDAAEAIDPLRKELRKARGLQRTLITQWEGAGDTERHPGKKQPHGPSLRHSRRRPKRTEQIGDCLSTVGRPGVEDAAVPLEESREPASCPATPVQSASGGRVQGSSETQSGPRPGSECVKEQPASSKRARGRGERGDTSNCDSSCALEGLHLSRRPEQEPAERCLEGARNRLRRTRREEEPSNTVEVEAGSAGHDVLPCKRHTEAAWRAVSQAAEGGRERDSEAAMFRGPADRGPRNPGGPQPEREAYDPRTLYCICRQPHGDRLMICCDRCEEWFHGDCVGISEAQGRLLERNKDEYICPNCSILRVQEEMISEVPADREPGCRYAGAECAACESRGTGEPRPTASQGSKGRPEEAASPGAGKTEMVPPVTVAPGAVPCAGPGCSEAARPDTVYCSNDCILRHAAAAVRSLRARKELRPKPEKKVKTQAEKLQLPKPRVQAGIKMSSVHKRPAPEEIDNPAMNVMMTPLRSDTTGKEVPFWASDHKSSTVMPEKTAVPSSPRWGKSVKDDRRVKDTVVGAASGPKKTALPGSLVGRPPSSRALIPKKPPPLTNMAGAKSAIKKSPSGFRGAIPKRPWLLDAPSGTSAARQVGPVPVPLAGNSEKSPCSAALVQASRRPVAAATVPAASPAPGCLRAAGPALSRPKPQIRPRRIRRSLKKSLWKRVRESGDLITTESEVGRTTLDLEKRTFNLFQAPDDHCGSKCCSVTLHLQDPETQVIRSQCKGQQDSKDGAMKPETIPAMECPPPVQGRDELRKSVRAAHVKRTAPLFSVPSSRVKDWTSRHQAHLFDLNCKIGTGEVPSEDELAPKRQKLSTFAKKEDLQWQPRSSPPDPVPPLSGAGSPVTLPRDAFQPHLERASVPRPPGKRRLGPSPWEGPSSFPASCGVGVVTMVTVSAQDPRTARSRTCTIMASAAGHLDGAHTDETKPDLPKPALTSVMVPKAILSKPSASPDWRHLSVPPSPSVSISESRSPRAGDTTLPLSRLSTIWKGLINMQSVGKFVTKAHPVSGSSVHLSEDLPDTIHIGGRIAPKTVWDYVGKLRASVSKELCLIRFHPAAQEEEGTYASLYSYFSSCGRFGVVANTSRRVKDLYLIPLSAKDPLPPSLLPFEGPGLESPRPDLLLGLVVSEKQNRPPDAGKLEKIREKQDPSEAAGHRGLPAAPQAKRKPPKDQLYSAAVGATPPPSLLLPLPLPEPPVSTAPSSLPPGATCSVTAPAAVAPAPTAASPVTPRTLDPASPLQFILRTLFKGSSFQAPPTPQQGCKAKGQGGVLGALLLDPIVQRFGHFSNNGTREEEEEEEDQPYDPEEGYDMERAVDTPPAKRRKQCDVKKAPDAAGKAEVAYDPEDETFLEAARVTVLDLPSAMCADLGSSSQEWPGHHTKCGHPPAWQGRQGMKEDLESSLAKGQLLPQEQQAPDQSRGALGTNHASHSRHSRDPRQARHLGESSGCKTLAGAPRC